MPPAIADRSRAPIAPARNHGALPAHLPRYEVVIDAEHRACPCCGGAMHGIGELRTEQLDIVPAQLRVRVTRRPRYACRACEGAVVVAPAPERPIDGGMPTEALIVHVVVSKFCDSLPLYRQSQMLARQGIDAGPLDAEQLGGPRLLVADAALRSGASARCCRRPSCSPTTPRCRCSIPAAAGPRRGACGAMRSMTGPGAARAIRRPPMSIPRTARTRARPSTWRASRACCRSTAMTGSSGWPAIAPTARCAWRSAGRTCGAASIEFHASTKSPLAAEVLARIRALYAIEAEIRGHPAEHRRQVRQERSRPIVEALHDWLQDHLPRVSGASDLAKAIRYALRHWPGLIVFLDDGRIEMGKVEVWRGCCRLNISVAAPFVRRCLTGPTLAPSPHPARQTGHADFPHPAFSRPVRPSLSAGRRVAVERCRGRASRRDTRLGSGGTQRLVVPRGASTSGGPVAPCMPERAHRFL